MNQKDTISVVIPMYNSAKTIARALESVKIQKISFEKVIVVNDIPRTKNGKIVELAVKNVIEGKEIKNKEALANPEVLEQFKDLKELRY